FLPYISFPTARPRHRFPTLPLPDALPIFARGVPGPPQRLAEEAVQPDGLVPCHRPGRHVHLDVVAGDLGLEVLLAEVGQHLAVRSEEHTSELQSRENLVCRLLLEK